MDPRELAQYEAQESAASQQSEVEEAVVGGYRVIRTLGRGAFGVVLLGQRDDGELAAIKMLPRGDRVRQYRTYVAREILHHASLRHPFIVGVKEVMLTEKSLCIAMEYAAGGTVLAHLTARRPARRLCEAEARWMFQQLAIGLAYCHARGVANRDLKLENLLLDRPTSGADGDWPLLRICDFGYSKHELNSTAKTGVGTPLYMAPEVIAGSAKYDAKRADMWSCGIILYTLLFGRYPFDTADRDFARRIAAGQWAMPPEAVALSAECRDMLARLLAADPAQRIDTAGVFCHPWFLRDLPEGALGMNGWYLANAPSLDQCVSVVAQLVEAASERGAPGEPTRRVQFESLESLGAAGCQPPPG